MPMAAMKNEKKGMKKTNDELNFFWEHIYKYQNTWQTHPQKLAMKGKEPNT